MDDLNSYLNKLNETISERMSDVGDEAKSRLGDELLGISAPFVEQSLRHPLVKENVKKGAKYVGKKLSDLKDGASLDDVMSGIKEDAQKHVSAIRNNIQDRMSNLQDRFGIRRQQEGPEEIEMQELQPRDIEMQEMAPTRYDQSELLPQGAGDISQAGQDVARTQSTLSSDDIQRLTQPDTADDFNKLATTQSTAEDAAQDAAKGITASLGESTEDSLAADADPLDLAVTAGLGLATLFSSFGELFSPHHTAQIANASSQFGV